MKILKTKKRSLFNMKYKLYNGEIELDFNEEKHLYTVNGKKVDGTTGVLNVISKPALMYWAVNMSVEFFQTAIKPGVVYDEVQLKAMADGMKTAHRKRSTDAADIGKMVHDWIKSYLEGKKPAMPVNEQILNAVKTFLAWEKEYNVKFLHSEKILYSKKYNYAGTLDFIAEMDTPDHDGRIKVLGDFKTSSGIWDEYWFQTAAYQQAYLEEFPEEFIAGQTIVRIGKDGSLEVKNSKPGDYEENLEAFNAALILHRRINVLKDEAYQLKKAQGLL